MPVCGFGVVFKLNRVFLRGAAMCVLASSLTFEHVGTFARIKPLLGLSDFSAFNQFKSIRKVFKTVYNIV